MTARLGDGRLPAHFWSKVEIGPVSEYRPDLGRCWIWTGAITSRGYGCWQLNGTRQSTHRIAYEVYVDPIPEGLTIDHLCRVKPCCNPTHLDPVTSLVNTQRAFADQTHCLRGHPLAGDNLARHATTGARVCIECRRQHSRDYRARGRVLAAAS